MNARDINTRNSMSKLLILALVTTHPRIVSTARWLNYLLLELTGYFTKLRCCLSHNNYLLRTRSATYARSSPGIHVAARHTTGSSSALGAWRARRNESVEFCSSVHTAVCVRYEMITKPYREARNVCGVSAYLCVVYNFCCAHRIMSNTTNISLACLKPEMLVFRFVHRWFYRHEVDYRIH